MITYTDGTDREAVITAVSETGWTASVYESFADYRNCQTPTETRAFPGTPNRRAMLSAWPGWTPRVRDDGNWSLLPESTDDLPELPAVPVSVTARQIRLWLVRHGVSLAQVDAAIDAIPDAQQREECRVEWDWAPYVLRSHPLLVPLAAALGLSEAQVDDAFREASTI
jgi:hypothetical protein